MCVTRERSGLRSLRRQRVNPRRVTDGTLKLVVLLNSLSQFLSSTTFLLTIEDESYERGFLLSEVIECV